MLRAGIVFFSSLGGLVVTAMLSNDADFVFSAIGYTVVIVYVANVITRLILSVVPKDVISPFGKAVVITGCDSGFGLELAKRLSSEGFSVYACCLSTESEGASQLQERGVEVIECDVTRNDHVHDAFIKVNTDLGDKELWCLVNNAGVAIFSELEWCSQSVIDHMFNVNVLGAVRMTKAFLPLLRRAGGRVVIMSSVAGHVTYPGFISYSMTKHALVSLSDGLRREMIKWGVSVTRIEPAMYKTRISRSDVLSGALDNSWERTPDEIKEAYGFPYYQDFKGRMQKLAMKARPYLDEVVDSMARAVTEVQPQIVYRVSGPADKVRLWLMCLMPTKLLDIIICKIIQPSHRQLSGSSSSPPTSSSS